MLFFQGLLFYMPHWIWKNWEEGRMRMISDGLRGNMIISPDERKGRQSRLVKYLYESLNTHNSYSFGYFICEALNFVNVVSILPQRTSQRTTSSNHSLLADWQHLLRGQVPRRCFPHLRFRSAQVQRHGSGESLGSHDRGSYFISYTSPSLYALTSKSSFQIFPRVTKCTFHKYGASGSIQKHDALCVLALNILNEKIYIFLWYAPKQHSPLPIQY